MKFSLCCKRATKERGNKNRRIRIFHFSLYNEQCFELMIQVRDETSYVNKKNLNVPLSLLLLIFAMLKNRGNREEYWRGMVQPQMQQE